MSEEMTQIGLDDVLITQQLALRSPRTPNLQAEIHALHTLARQLAQQPQTMLKTLVTVAKELCEAGSAGVSLLEVTSNGEEVFRWVALAGALAAYEQGTVERHLSPCGVCLERQAPQLYSYPGRYFTELQHVQPQIVEGLVIPLACDRQPLGAIWIVSHDQVRQFDAEDVRILTSLADFSAAALQSIHLRQTAHSALQREQAARTEAEATRQALDKAAQQAVNILESITDAFICLDQEWRITYANCEAARLNNMQPEEMIGKTHWEMWPWSVGTVVERTYRQVVADRQAAHFEFLYEPLMIWLEIHAYPCEVGLSIYFRDISERKRNEAERQQAQAALRQSESRFRLIVESAKDYAIFSQNLDGTIASWNSGAERLLGYKEAEIIGCHSRIIFTPEDNEQGQAEGEIQTALTQGRAEDERWHVRKDGSRFFASGLMMQLLDEAGNLQGLLKILRDVTASRQAAEREQFLAQASAVLAASIDYKTTLFNIARQAVPFLADFCFFDLIDANNQIERVAWHHVDPVKQDWFEQVQRYVPPQDRDHPINNVLANGNANLVPDVTDAWMQAAATSAEHLQFMQDSQVRSLITVPLIAHNRQLGALTLCLSAASHRHYTQQDLALAEELAHRAALALDNARLYHQAQEANRIKDEFLAVLSHELRSPLNPILGWAKLLQSSKLDRDKIAQGLAAIERNAQLQSQLVEDLLDISRILRGKLSLNLASVNLAAIIRAALETVRQAAQSKSIQIQVTLDPQVGLVSGDATRLQQVVWNLLSNAVKFTPAGGRIQVRLQQLGDLAQITISDTGIGIAPDFLPYVFDYFRQADSTTTRKFGGLGLGLAIVRQLVEAHGGTVQVESPGEGLGATFTVRLPLLPIQLKLERDNQHLEPSLNLNGTQILVVDNEPDALELVAFVLEQTKARVIKATCAGEALAALMQSVPDVLVSDLGMPDTDGYMLIEQVRALPPEQGGQIPAIALSAYAGDLHHQQALSAGFQRHISKPIDPEQLVQAIAELVQQNNWR